MIGHFVRRMGRIGARDDPEPYRGTDVGTAFAPKIFKLIKRPKLGRKERQMRKRWIVVANRTEARIYRDRPFKLIETLDNALGREKNRAMTTDKPSVTGENDPHEDAARQFARRLGRFLELGNYSGRYDEIVLAAEPKMLGRIRSFIDRHLSRKIEWLRKDFGHLSDYEVSRVFGLARRQGY